MKPLLQLIELKGIPILQQLQWEEALLRTDEQNWCIFNQGAAAAIVMGISGKPDQLICSKKMAQHPLPIIRRFSGGGTVVIDENTFFITLICQSTALSIPLFPRSLMEWTATLYRPIFNTQAFQIRENDYVIGDLKWGGNAQAIKRNRWLHHSSILWNYNPKLMDYLKMPASMPEYRQGRTHNDFVCRLSDHYTSLDLFKKLFVQELGNHFEIKKGNLSEIEEKEKIPHRKMTKKITANRD